MQFKIREANLTDIPQIQHVRNSVHENQLSDPSLVTDEDCAHYMTVRGKAWVCEIDGVVHGFAFADMVGHSIWALFVHRDYIRSGMGKQLHKVMLDWYFINTSETVWLTTAPETRAELFYEKQGWTKIGMQGKEVRFEMTAGDWQRFSVT